MKIKFIPLVLAISLMLPNVAFCTSESVLSEIYDMPSGIQDITKYYTHMLRGMKRMDISLEEIANNTEKPTVFYYGSGLFPVNYYDTLSSDYQPPIQVYKDAMKDRAKLVDYWDTNTVPPQRYMDTSKSPKHLSNLNMLISDNVLHRDSKYSTFVFTKESSTVFSCDIDNTMYKNPTGQFSRSDAIMALSKVYGGVIPSRAITGHSARIFRNFGKGLQEVPLDIDKLRKIPVSAIHDKSDLDGLQYGLTNAFIRYDFGDSFPYINPNVYELYFLKAIGDGIISLNDFDAKSQTYKDLYAVLNNYAAKPRWLNSLKEFDVNEVAPSFLQSTDMEKGSTSSPAKYIAGSKPLGNSFSYQLSGVSFNQTSPTVCDNPPNNLGSIKTVIKKNGVNYFASEEMSVADFYILISKFMQSKEITLTQKEMDAVQFFFGATYTTKSPELSKALDYLIATGIINPEDSQEINNVEQTLTNDKALELLKRVKHPNLRYTLKKLELTESDIVFRDKGFKKNTIEVTQYDSPVSIEDVSTAESDTQQLEDKFDIHISVELTNAQVSKLSVTPSTPSNWYLTEQDDWSQNRGALGIDYTYKFANNTMYFNLTKEYFAKLKSIGNPITINSSDGSDVPTYMSTITSAGDYYVSAEAKSGSDIIWNLKLKNPVVEFFKSLTLPKAFADDTIQTTTRRDYEVTSLLIANADYELDNYIYKPSNKTVYKIMEGGEALYPSGIVSIVPNGSTSLKGYYITQKVMATSMFEASGIAKANLAPKQSSKTFKILGYTKDGTTLISESELAQYNIVQKYDKLLINEATKTPLILPGDSTMVMSGSQILKLPSGTVRAGVSGKDAFYNLDAISLILSTTQIAKVYNNSALLLNLPNERKQEIGIDDSNITDIYNSGGTDIIDKTNRIDGTPTNFYSISALNVATSSVVMTDIENKFTIIMKLGFAMDSNEMTATLSTDDIRQLLTYPQDGRDSTTQKKWLAMHNGFMQSVIPAYKSRNYYLKPHFTVLTDDSSANSEARVKATTFLRESYARASGAHLTDDEEKEFYEFLNWKDSTNLFKRMPNNTVFARPDFLDLKWNGQHIIYAPKVEFKEAKAPLGSMAEYQKVTFKGNTYTVLNPSTAGTTTLETSSKPLKILMKNYDPTKLVAQIKSSWSEIEKAAIDVKIENVELSRVKPTLGLGQYILIKSKFYKVQNPSVTMPNVINTYGTMALTYTTNSNKPAYLQQVPESSIDKNATVYVYPQLVFQPNYFMLDKKTTPPNVVQRRLFPDMDASNYSANIVGSIIAQVDKVSIMDKRVKVGSTIFFGTLKATKVSNSPPTFQINMTRSRGVSINSSNFISIWSSTLYPEFRLKFYTALANLPLNKGAPVKVNVGGKTDVANQLNKQGEGFYIGNTALGVASKRVSNFSVNFDFTDEGFLVVPLLNGGDDTFIAVGNLDHGVVQEGFMYNIMQGQSLNFDRNALSYTLGNGADYLKSLFVSLKQNILKRYLTDQQIDEAIKYTKQAAMSYVVVMWVMTISLKSFHLSTRWGLFRELKERTGYDFIKIFTLKLWSVESDMGIQYVMLKLLLITVVGRVIQRI